MKVKYLFFFLFFLWSCGSLERSVESGYGSDKRQPPFTPHKNDFEERQLLKAQIELGYPEQKILNSYEKNQLKNRMILNTLIQNLNPDEYTQFYKYHSTFLNDQEKIRFLSLKSIKDRENWIKKNEPLSFPLSREPSTVLNLIQNQDITIGMSKKSVIESWGSPIEKKIAGNPLFQNEHWIYEIPILKGDTPVNQIRDVYFESGRVTRWSTRSN